MSTNSIIYFGVVKVFLAQFSICKPYILDSRSQRRITIVKTVHVELIFWNVPLFQIVFVHSRIQTYHYTFRTLIPATEYGYSFTTCHVYSIFLFNLQPSNPNRVLELFWNEFLRSWSRRELTKIGCLPS